MAQMNDPKPNNSKHQILIVFSIGLAIALLFYGLFGAKEDVKSAVAINPNTAKLDGQIENSESKPVPQVADATTVVGEGSQKSQIKEQVVVEKKVSFDEFKVDLDVLSGNLEVGTSQDIKKYDVQAIFREVIPGGLERPGIFVTLIIANVLSDGERDIYKGEVELKGQNVFHLKNMQRMVNDEVRDKYGKYALRSQFSIYGVPEVFEATINSSDTIDLKSIDPRKGGWVGSLSKLQTTFISNFEGRWAGSLGDKKASLEVKKVNGKYLANIKVQKKYPCELKEAWVRPIGANRISIIGGETKGWTKECGTGEPLFRLQLNEDGSIQLMAYSTDINRSPVAGQFKR